MVRRCSFRLAALLLCLVLTGPAPTTGSAAAVARWRDTVYLVDCDSGTYDMVLNAVLCLARALGSRELAVASTSILCMHDQCCAQARADGLRTLDDRAARALRDGFVSRGHPKAYLDHIQLLRDFAVLALLREGKSVLLKRDYENAFNEAEPAEFLAAC